MKKMKHRLFQILCIYALSVYEISCISLFECDNILQTEALDKSGKNKAAVFKRDCGATTQTSLHISILSANETLPKDAAGNVFIAEQTNGPLSTEITWLSDHELNVRHGNGRIFKKSSAFSGVKISYTSDDDQSKLRKRP